MDQDLTLLHEKIDYLTAQIDAQRQRQAKWEDLTGDLAPVANDILRMTMHGMNDLGDDVELADIAYLVKRLLRDIRMLTGLLGTLESAVELAGDAQEIVQPMFGELTDALQKLEQRGYFKFASGATYVVDQIVTEFDEDDVRALGDNIVTILGAVRNMTQPEVMALANRAIEGIQNPVNDDISTWGLIKELRDPEVRKGFARMLHMVRAMGNDPAPQPANGN
jgi:uncharacterized protein YjgD (DUF1641 family)